MNYKILLAAPLAAFLVSVSATSLITPANWSVAAAGNKEKGWYEWGVDPQHLRDGQQVLTMRAFKTPTTATYAATYTQGYNFQGQRVRLSGWVRGQDVAGWGGVFLGTSQDDEPWGLDRQSRQPLAAGFGRGRPGDGQWRPFSIVMTVPADAPEVRVGVMLNGPGEVSVSGLRFEAVGATEAETTDRSAVDVDAIRASRSRPQKALTTNDKPRMPGNLEMNP